MRNHGTDPDTRFGRMRERVEAMKAIWTEDEAEYHGRIVDFDPIWSWPKPVQKPHPPMLVGGLGREGARPRAWPTATSGSRTGCAARSSWRERIDELQRRAEAAGREPIPVTVFGAKPEVRLLERLKAAGVDALPLLRRPGARPTRWSASSTSCARGGRRSGPARRARPVARRSRRRSTAQRLAAAQTRLTALRLALGGKLPATRSGSARRSPSCSRAGTPRARAARSSGSSSRSTRATCAWRSSRRPPTTRSATTSCGASGPRCPASAA